MSIPLVRPSLTKKRKGWIGHEKEDFLYVGFSYSKAREDEEEGRKSFTLGVPLNRKEQQVFIKQLL